MARSRFTQPYLIEEPTTGLYVSFAGERAHLSRAGGATRFTTASDALLECSASLHDQPHELVRVDA